MIATAIALLGGWTGFLIGAIRWLLNRQITALDARLASAERKAGEAVVSVTTHKQTVSDLLAQQKEAASNSLAALELKFSQRSVCANHQRMEENDKDLFKRLDSLHGDIRELVGVVTGLANSVELVNEHLLNAGGK